MTGGGKTLSREAAWAVFTELTKSESLTKHGLTVEAVMRAFAAKNGADEDLWGMVGLLHDFDYEQYPDVQEHAVVGGRILRERGFPEEIVLAVMSHNAATGVQRQSLLEKTLFAVDELTGLITAAALVQPSKSIHPVTLASVRKKMKDKAFARSVSRDDTIQGAADLGVDLDEHLAFVIEAMQRAAPVLGLDGR